MSLKLKVLKSKTFESKGSSYMHHTCAYKGRVFGVSTMRWDGVNLEVVDGVLTLPDEVEVLKHTSVDPLTGETKVFLDIVPALGIGLAVI